MLQLLTIAVLAAGTVVPAENNLVAQADAAPTPKLDWAPCTEEGLRQYECAIADVPLDYTKPHGAKLGVAVLRQRATGDRIGTLFTAVGGPGGSGIDAAKDGLASPEISKRFDVVTFDQRGVVRSRQVKCFASPEEQAHFWDTVPMPPATKAEEKRTTKGTKAFTEGCARHNPDLVNNLTTVDVARDLDLLRRAVGDAKLTYTGGSYASYIGEVYGALFGDRVRALQLNAMMDPVSYSTSTLSALSERAQGTAGVWAEFARLCTQAGKPACAFAGPDVHGRNASLLTKLKNGPMTVGRGEAAVQVRYQDLVPAQVQMLYDTQGWPVLAAILDAIERGPDGDPEIAGAILGGAGFRFDFLSSFIAISCADIDVPKTPELWPLLAKAFDAGIPNYGRHWLYMTQPCATWAKVKQRYTGPWRLTSDVPALLINNRFDPVTPLSMAVKAQREMGNARLLVVEGHGHAIVNACTDKVRAEYLIDLKLPADGSSCAPDRRPFDGV